MARIRSIKPEFFLDEDLAELSAFARLAFPGLWCQADGHGRLEDRPKRLKLQILPYDPVDFDAVLQELHDGGFILRYVVDGNSIIQILNFSKHQRITGREAVEESSLPEPESCDGKQRGNNAETLGKQQGNTLSRGREWKGRERKGGEGGVGETKTSNMNGKPSKNGKHGAPPPFKPPSKEEIQNFMGSLGKPDAISADRFLEYYGQRDWKIQNRPMRDWQLTVQRWIAEDEKKNPPKPKIDHEAYPVQ